MLTKSEILALFPNSQGYFVDGIDPILLSEVKDNTYTLYKWISKESDGYQILFAPETFQLGYLKITFGYKKNHPGYLLNHKSMSDVKDKKFEFKHYRNNGSKFWTSHDGMEFTLSIPLDQITLVPIRGLSYVKIVINGVPLSLNVSGGTSNGWTDWVSENPHSSINIPIRKMKKIMAVANRAEDYSYSVMATRSTNALDYIFAEAEESEIPGYDQPSKELKIKFIGVGTKSWCQRTVKNLYKGKKTYICRDTEKGRKQLKRTITKNMLKEAGNGVWVRVTEVEHF